MMALHRILLSFGLIATIAILLLQQWRLFLVVRWETRKNLSQPCLISMEEGLPLESVEAQAQSSHGKLSNEQSLLSNPAITRNQVVNKSDDLRVSQPYETSVNTSSISSTRNWRKVEGSLTTRIIPRKRVIQKGRKYFPTKVIADARETGSTDQNLKRVSQPMDAVENTESILPKRRWAYAYLIAGCDDKNPGYRGMVYNVLVSARLLQSSGSKADVVVMVQMSRESKATTLPEEEERVLKEMNVKVIYIPVSREHQNFYSVQLLKFRILDLVEYSRVIYMDGDVMPFCSLDYLFELSEPLEEVHSDKLVKTSGQSVPRLKENIVLAWLSEPAHGGFFMLRPGPGEYAEIQEIIAKRHEESMHLPPPNHFDEVKGWGHEIKPPDCWRSLYAKEAHKSNNDTLWNWYGAFADQGLLYHWTKYVKKSVSIVFRSKVENWSSSNKKTKGNETSVRREKLMNEFPLQNYTCLPPEMEFEGNYASNRIPFKRVVPFRDFRHFVGRKKPWRRKYYPTKELEDIAISSDETIKAISNSSDDYWFHVFREIKNDLNMTLDINSLRKSEKIPFGSVVGPQQLRESLWYAQREKERSTRLQKFKKKTTKTKPLEK